jgi:hypothetical protein
VKIIYAHFEHDTHYLGLLTKLRQTITSIDFIMTFEQLAICTRGMFDSFFKECLINGLKEEI